MAKDLGTITHEIRTTGGSGGGSSEGGGGGTSSTDDVSGSGRGGGGKGGLGGIGDVIRGLTRGGPLGGGQALAKLLGFAKLAIGIGVAIAAIALVGLVIKKVIGTLVKWTKEIENGITKFSAYNAQLAAVSAIAHIGKITRDIKSAGILAGSYAVTGRSMERIRESFRPVSDAWSLVKANIINTFLPVLERLVGALRLMTIKILEAVVWLNEAGITAGSFAGAVIDYGVFGIGGGGFARGVLGIEGADEADEEFMKGIKEIIGILKRGFEDQDISKVNEFIGTVGVQLTDGAWNPWLGGETTPTTPSRAEQNRGTWTPGGVAP